MIPPAVSHARRPPVYPRTRAMPLTLLIACLADPIHTCDDVPEYCPDAKTLTDMKTMSIWAEGKEGEVHLEVDSVSGYGCTGKVVEN